MPGLGLLEGLAVGIAAAFEILVNLCYSMRFMVQTGLELR